MCIRDSAYHEGEPPDQRARKVAATRGYDISRLRARRVNDRDFSRFDRILAMDRQNLEFLRRSCPKENLSRLGLFLDFADDLAPDEVPDPYYGGIEGFEKVLDLCEQGAISLIESIARSAVQSQVKRR